MNLFQNSQGYCDGSEEQYGISKTVCEDPTNPLGTWRTHDINFDTYISSMISLFVLSTLEGWPDYILLLIDGGPDYPIQDNQMYTIPLFIVFIMFGSIICINLLIAILSINF
jgi:hypothetical protein